MDFKVESRWRQMDEQLQNSGVLLVHPTPLFQLV